MSFSEAKSFLKPLRLKDNTEYLEYMNGKHPTHPPPPLSLPRSPEWTYRNDNWNGVPDYIGSKFIAHKKREYRPFKKARNFARKLKLKNRDEWQLYCKGKLKGYSKKPDDMPSGPGSVYKTEWQGWGDFLATGTVANHRREFKPFKQARLFVKNLKLRSYKEWQLYTKGELKDRAKKPDDIPSAPDRTYRAEWQGWQDFLGTEKISRRGRKFKTFDEVKCFAKKLKLRSLKEWQSYSKGELKGYSKRPDDIPSSPQSTFREDWKGWGDFLGTGRVAPQNKVFKTFKQARSFVRKLKLKNNREWRLYTKGELKAHSKKPDDIPSTPEDVYKENWNGWKDFLGTT